MAKTTTRKDKKVDAAQRLLQKNAHEREVLATTKIDAQRRRKAEIEKLQGELHEQEMSETTKREKYDALWALMAEAEVDRMVASRTDTPAFDPSAWRHRALSDLGRMGGKASAKSLTPRQRTERARKAGLARQAKARKAAKKGGAK